jgi:Predicted esterase
MAHGTEDPVIPLAWAARSRDALISLGYAVEWHEYAMPHSSAPKKSPTSHTGSAASSPPLVS